MFSQWWTPFGYFFGKEPNQSTIAGVTPLLVDMQRDAKRKPTSFLKMVGLFRSVLKEMPTEANHVYWGASGRETLRWCAIRTWGGIASTHFGLVSPKMNLAPQRKYPEIVHTENHSR